LSTGAETERSEGATASPRRVHCPVKYGRSLRRLTVNPSGREV